jgi:tRNA(fMet)-specific endonuclease VapC
MKYLLDTNVCIKFLSGREAKLAAKFAAIPAQDKLLSAVVKAELYYGGCKSQRRHATLKTLEDFFARFISLPFDDRAAAVFGEIRAKLSGKGTPIGPYDMQIAATAIANDLTLVTHNVKEFTRIDRLRIEDWEA